MGWGESHLKINRPHPCLSPWGANLYTQVCIRLNNNKFKKRYTLKKKEEKGRKLFLSKKKTQAFHKKEEKRCEQARTDRVFTFLTLFESALALFPSLFLDKSLSLGKLKTSFRLLSLNRDFQAVFNRSTKNIW